MFKVAKNLSTPIVSEIFEKQNNVYDLRNSSEFVLTNIHSIFRGIESVSYLGPQVWNINAFKRKVKKWKPDNCPCRGYVNRTYKV